MIAYIFGVALVAWLMSPALLAVAWEIVQRRPAKVGGTITIIKD